MADIKQIQVGGITYNLKDEVARETLEGKQDAFDDVTAEVDNSTGTPSVTTSMNNKNLHFAFQGLKGDTGATGPQGPQGDSVLVGQGDLTLAHVLGNLNYKAMSQKGVKDAIVDISAVSWGINEEEGGQVESLTINDQGESVTSTSDNIVHYVAVEENEIVRINFASTSNTTQKYVAFFSSIPENGAQGILIDNIDAKAFSETYVAYANGYICISSNGAETTCIVNRAVTVKDMANEAYENTVYDEQSVEHYDNSICTKTRKAIRRTDGSIVTATFDGWNASDYIELSGNEIIEYKNLQGHGASMYSGAYLYNSSKVGILAIYGDGVVDVADYPTAKYIVLAQSPDSPNPEMTITIPTEKKTVKQKIAEVEERIDDVEDELNYEDGGTAQYGNTSAVGNTQLATQNYEYIGLNCISEKEGTIKSVSVNPSSAGTLKLVTGVFDSTHGTFDISGNYSYSVANNGMQSITTNIPIKEGETLLVDVSGVNVIANVYYSGVPSELVKGINKTSQDQSFAVGSKVTMNFLWTVEFEGVTLKEQISKNVHDIDDIKSEDTALSQRITNVENAKNLILGNDGVVYRLVVNNGVLGIEPTTYQHILVLAHSFGAIVTQDHSSVWERGMSSSKVESDWVSRINSVFHGNVQRVKMVDWEQAFPNPASTLPTLLDDYLTNEIDAIFIMCGANVPSLYSTEAYGEANFAALVDYCKEGSPNADIFVCSPGYTDETNAFNVGIKAGAESEGATYISTYCTYADKLANYGDVVFDFGNNAYSFVINSGGRVNHPNDIWHLYMANNILTSLGYNSLEIMHNIYYDTEADYRGYTRWAEGGHCTVCTFGSTAPTASIVDASGNNVACSVMSLSGVTWESTPPRTPTYAIHFDMPASDVTISISE